MDNVEEVDSYANANSFNIRSDALEESRNRMSPKEAVLGTVELGRGRGGPLVLAQKHMDYFNSTTT